MKMAQKKKRKPRKAKKAPPARALKKSRPHAKKAEPVKKDYSSSPVLRLIDSRNATLIVSLLFFTYTLLSTLRFPNIWSATQFLWNYNFGFIRRGLVGEIYEIFFLGDGKMEYITFVGISYGIFLIEMLGFFFVLRYALKYVRKGKIYLSHWFFSLSLAFQVHTVGYLDHLLFILLICIIFLPFRQKALYGSALVACSIIGMLTHEVFIFIAAPLIAFKMLYLWLADKKLLINLEDVFMKFSWPVIAILCMVILAVYFTMGPGVQTAVANKDALQHFLIAHADFPIRLDGIVLLERDASLVMYLMHEAIDEALANDWFTTISIATLPTIFFYFFLAHRVCFQLLSGWRAWFLWLGFSLSSLVPLMVIRLASDFSRWFSMSGTLSFVLLLCLIITAKKEVTFKNLYIVLLWLAVCSVPLYSKIPLMDGYEVLDFPFIEHWHYLKDVERGTNTFPPVIHR